MSDSVITVENLSKKYTIQHANGRRRDDGLRHVLQNAALAPWHWLRKAASSNGANGQSRSPISDLQSSTSNFRSRSSEEFWALRDVSFEVKQGEVVGIIGRNGAGKSTLLKILSRITEPTNGRICIMGRVASLLEVGTGFHPELTGRENVFLNGAILGMTRAEIKKKFEEIVAFAGVEKFLDTPVKRYSSGMYVRLAFAVAAHLEPEILIVDEVLAVGDMQFQKKCLGKMHDIATNEGRTVLFVSHNMAAMQNLCTRGLLVSDGRLLCDVGAEDAVAQYLRGTCNEGGSWKSPGLSVKVSFLDSTRRPMSCWGYGDELILRVEVNSALPIANPAVDLAFYSESGAKVFAVQTDKLRTGSATPLETSNFLLELGIQNIGLAVPVLTVDIGVRSGGLPDYIAWWQRIETLVVSARKLETYHVNDAILAPPARILAVEDRND